MALLTAPSIEVVTESASPSRCCSASAVKVAGKRKDLEPAEFAHAVHRAPQGGEVYLPLRERLESELAALKAKEDMMERARVRAARFMREHSIKK
ncbi:hypothetical protein ABIA00_006120 [Bradyrhizobium ottawaense]|uniref:hypothetical protein n=1 Tax=Bradyrhizobium ottawaense TaxID=931866 RepID=UPI0038363DAD